jgi:hypothetical protein
MSSHEQGSQANASTVHLSPELKDLISNSKYVGPAFPHLDDLIRLVNLFGAVHSHEFPHASKMTAEGRREVDGLWLVILTGAVFALNAVEAIPTLYSYAVAQADGDEGKKLFVAERIREVGLKTVSFMGVPRVCVLLHLFENR